MIAITPRTKQTPYADRRRALKAAMLNDVATWVRDGIPSWPYLADDLGLSEVSLQSLQDEIAGELERRSDRLATS